MRKLVIFYLAMQGMWFSSSGQHSLKIALQYAKIDSLANHWPANTPGGVIAVLENGKVIYYRAFGLANLPHQVKVSSKTLFNIGSAAKQFTGLAFAILANRNIISLNDPIRM